MFIPTSQFLNLSCSLYNDLRPIKPVQFVILKCTRQNGVESPARDILHVWGNPALLHHLINFCYAMENITTLHHIQMLITNNHPHIILPSRVPHQPPNLHNQTVLTIPLYHLSFHPFLLPLFVQLRYLQLVEVIHAPALQFIIIIIIRIVFQLCTHVRIASL